MSVGLEDLIGILNPEEPDYEAAAAMGAEALPHLQTLVDGPDPALASKAAYLAGRIGGSRAVPVLESAAAKPDLSIRAGAAGGVRHLKAPEAEPILIRLLDDGDVAVVKTALLAVPDLPSPALEHKLILLRNKELPPAVRDLAEKVHDRVRSGRPGGDADR